MIALILASIPTGLGLGAGRGFGFHPAVPGALALPFALGLWGGLVVAMLGLLIWPIGWVLGARRSILDRPLRLPWPWRGRAMSDSSEVRSARWRFLAWCTWRRTLLWLGLVPVLTAFAGSVVVGVYAGRYVDRRLVAAIAAADRDDPRWRLDDLMADREIVPDEENGALVVAEALSRMPADWLGSHSYFPGTPKAREGPAGQAFDRLSKVEDRVRLDDAMAAALRQALGTYEESVLLARTLADYRRGQHGLELTPDLISTPLAETQDCRIVARLLTADAAIRAQDGDLDGALDSCRAILGVARSIGDEPFLISGLVRVAIGGVAMNSVRRVLAQGEPSDDALARVQADVLDELAYPLLLQGYRGERAQMDEIIRRIRDGEIPIESLSASDGRDERDAWPARAIAPWGRLWFDHQRAVGLEWTNALVSLARQSPSRWPALQKAWDAKVLSVRNSWYGMRGAVLPLLLMPAMSAAGTAQLRYQADLGTAAILLAAERQRRRTGEWPPSVDAIDAEILATAPADPFTGQPYRIERRDGQCVVHSVGPNRRDERGDYDVKKWPQGPQDDVGARGWDVPRRGQSPPEPG